MFRIASAMASATYPGLVAKEKVLSACNSFRKSQALAEGIALVREERAARLRIKENNHDIKTVRKLRRLEVRDEDGLRESRSGEMKLHKDSYYRWEGVALIYRKRGEETKGAIATFYDYMRRHFHMKAAKSVLAAAKIAAANENYYEEAECKRKALSVLDDLGRSHLSKQNILLAIRLEEEIGKLDRIIDNLRGEKKFRHWKQ